MFGLVTGLTIYSKEVVGGRCIRRNDGNLCFNEKEIGNVWKDYMVVVVELPQAPEDDPQKR